MKCGIIKSALFLLLFTIPAVTCFSVRIDGTDDGIEWADAGCNVLINQKDSNNVDYGSLSYLVDKNSFDVYFLIYFSDKSDTNYDSAGILLTFGNDVISIDCKGNVTNPAPNSYVIKSSVSVVSNDGCYCELMIGFKKGLSERTSGKICFIDGEGTHSYHYPFTVINQYAAAPSDPSSTENNVAEKTTKEKATVHKTTKARVTKSELSATDKADDKTNQKNSNNKHDKTVVYFFEKDVVISEVYVGAGDNGLSEPVCEINDENSVQQLSLAENNAAIYNKGVVIFRVVCVISGFLLGIFAMCVGFNNKKKTVETSAAESTKKEQPESKEDNTDN